MKPNYSWKLDSTIFHSGNRSLQISNFYNKDSITFSPFSQICSIDIDRVKKLELTAYIKTIDVVNNVGLWCQLWDSNNKQIGFYSFATQQITVNGTTEFTKYAVDLFVNPDVKKLLLGGFLQGTGQVWYDNFAIEENTKLNTKSTSKNALRYLQSAIKIAKDSSIVSDSINWPRTEEEMKLIANGAQQTKDCYPAMHFLISQLNKKGDNHSGFYPPSYNTKNETENMDGRTSKSKYLNNNIGYIEVPGFESINTKISVDFAAKIQNQIKDLDSMYSVNKWIIDLRENTGGNMYPMIAGLGPILGNETLGYFTSPKQKLEYSWEYKNGSSIAYGQKICTVKNPYILKNEIQQIIVLIGSSTASSGEMTAISFIGNENTILIGQPSAAYSTGNGGHKLSDGAVLNLCESFCMDRNKNNILGSIKPNVIVEQSINKNEDSALEYAKKILLEK